MCVCACATKATEKKSTASGKWEERVMITILLSSLIHRYCPRSSSHSVSFITACRFLFCFKLFFKWYTHHSYMFLILVGDSLVLHTGKSIHKWNSLSKNCLKKANKEGNFYIFNINSALSSWLPFSLNKRFVLFISLNICPCAAQRSLSESFTEYFIELEDSWTSWVFISFKQQDCFLAGIVSADHVFHRAPDPVNKRGKIDGHTLKSWFSPWTHHHSSWLILGFSLHMGFRYRSPTERHIACLTYKINH